MFLVAGLAFLVLLSLVLSMAYSTQGHRRFALVTTVRQRQTPEVTATTRRLNRFHLSESEVPGTPLWCPMGLIEKRRRKRRKSRETVS